MNPLRGLPAVEKVLQALGPSPLPRPLIVRTVRTALAQLRRDGHIPPFEAVLDTVRSSLQQLDQGRLKSVINGTGVLLHTNLGRAPLGPEVIAHIATLAGHYSNLELDLGTGGRGRRASYLEQALALLCGAESATVVNNGAAALVVALRSLLRRDRTEVVISRGEMIQIGGGFRIPEILEASGARLREVGTTNRTSVADYAAAIGPGTALILKVHRSNFFMDGFVESPAPSDLAQLARRAKLPLMEDLGSGSVISTERFPGLEHERTPAESFKEGVQLVTCSGDKLLGGPQAGLIAGAARRIAAIKRDPFFRALRCDKLVLAALEATVDLYLHDKADCSIPLLRMLEASTEALEARAERIVEALNGSGVPAKMGHRQAQLGGGTLPRSSLPSLAVELTAPPDSLPNLATRLRQGAPPVIGCVSNGRLLIHVRTVFPEQDETLVAALRTAWSTSGDHSAGLSASPDRPA